MTAPAEVGCIILAAGLSSRMGSPKALLPWGEHTTVIEHIIQMAQHAPVRKVCVVVGHAAESITPLVIKCNAQVAVNNDYANGELLSSLNVGLRALPQTCDGALVLLGDQPLIQPETLQRVIQVWHDERPLAVVPTYQNQRGHPVLFSRALWPALLGLPDGAMPREVLAEHAADVRLLAVEDAGILLDIDTPQDYHRLRK